MPDDQRNTLRLSWAWWDGTELPVAPAEQTLALAGDLLARDHADLAAHEAALHNAEEMAAAERARIEAILADLQALESQVVPGP